MYAKYTTHNDDAQFNSYNIIINFRSACAREEMGRGARG